MSKQASHIRLHRIVERRNGWKLTVALVAMVLNGACNYLQKEPIGSPEIFGSVQHVPIGLHHLVSGYGEAFFGTVALSIIMRIVDVPVIWIMTIIFILGLLWEVSQQLGIMSGTADYMGDMMVYLAGALLGTQIGREREIRESHESIST